MKLTAQSKIRWDAFISHASEDKETIVRRLKKALEQRGLRIWLDEAQISPGARLASSIETGIKKSRYGIVILSHAFFSKRKEWPRRELRAFLKRDLVLPVLHDMTVADLRAKFPSLRDRYVIRTGAAHRTDNIDLGPVVRALAKKIDRRKTVDRSGSSRRRSRATGNVNQAVGLSRVFVDREAAVEPLFCDLKNCKQRAYFLGIAFSEGAQLERLVRIVRKKLTVEKRILLLDPFRSPAIFRTFLESSPEKMKSVVNFSWRHSNSHPYYDQRLFREFDRNYKFLVSEDGSLGSWIRFYGHNPNCWLVIIDDRAYFQPYTFGRRCGASVNEALGPHMPVFLFSGKSAAFEILADHFRRLWLTSETGLIQMRGRVEDRHRIIRNAFEQRSEWLKHVLGGLEQCGVHGDRRVVPRSRCRSPLSGIKIEWPTATGERTARVVLEDFSSNGLCVRTDEPSTLAIGMAVTVRGLVDTKSRAGKQVGKHFETFDNRFCVVHVRENRIGLLGMERRSPR